LGNRKQLLRFGQSQTQSGDVPEIPGAIDLHDVRGLPLAFGAGFTNLKIQLTRPLRR
jgi:hypothetical protein